LKITADESKDLYVIHFTTNGLLTRKILADARYLTTVFKGRILASVSLDGPEKLHDHLRGVKGNWRQALQTYRQLSQLKGIEASFGFTSSRYNAGTLQETLEELKKELPSLGLEKIYYNPAHNSPFYRNTTIPLAGEAGKVLKDIDYYLQNTSRLGFPTPFFQRRFLRVLKNYLQSGKYPFRRCAALTSSITLTSEGDILPCPFFSARLGSLSTGDCRLDRLLARPAPARLKAGILRHCPGCFSSCEAYHTLLAELAYVR
jgi:MoaA/NifB/PqqE/SkfB family radical SAM enzyme